ncbi:hypothetical protein OEZ86_011372 [Tetradesmus obliquus]|nr:hypothetical protein OEZ86_011372 [Tetradesmus obliquus]
MSKNTESVKVVVRCRPLNEKEKQDGRERIVDMDARQGQVAVRNPKSEEPPKTFTFDQVYDWNSEQATIFEITAKPIVDACMDGYNGTIFAYGQTGTGKSFTMEGRDDPPELRGIIPSTFNYVFDTISQQSGAKEFLVRASYLEIYNEEIRDLLSKNPQARLELKEHPDRGVYVKDLMQFVVKSVAEIGSVLQVGKKNRVVGATLMNQDSSRSHSIFTITIEATERHNSSQPDADGSSHIRVGKLNLVDLAGSERQSKTGATGDRLKEGIKINLSLTALGNVISALVDGKSGHIPYRDSKLTRLLQDSLGGNTKTVMVANVGPADWNFEETISTLRYANRAKNITNKPRINEDPKDAMLREFQDEIARLKAQLAARQGTGGAAGGIAADVQVVERVVEVEPDKAALVEQLRAQMKAEMEAQQEQQLQGQALEAARQEAEARARQQLESLMTASNATEEQRLALREALKGQIANMRALQAAAEKDKQEQQELLARIAAMEGKVLHGGENLLDKVEQLKQRSAATKTQLEVAARQQEEQRRRLEQLQLERLDLDAQYSCLEEEVAQKTKQLKALYVRYKERKAEATDVQAQFQAEREDLLADYRALTQQIKLKNLAIAAFIPPAYQDLIMAVCEWHEYEEKWVIANVHAAGNNIRTQRELDQAPAAPAAFDLCKHDAERLQRVYLTYSDLDADQETAAGSSSMANSGGQYGSSGRPSSARRTSRQAVVSASTGVLVGGIGARPGSAAARRTKELLLSAAAGNAGGIGGNGALQQKGRPGSSLLDGFAAADGRGSPAGGRAVSAAAAGDQQAVPKARGLVKGSTDAMRRQTRPQSRGL